MEWLLRIDVDWPADGDPSRRAQVEQEERNHVRRLLDEGRIVRLWRVPGQWASWSVWEARDAAELHDSVRELPLWPWTSVCVHALGQHPLETERRS